MATPRTTKKSSNTTSTKSSRISKKTREAHQLAQNWYRISMEAQGQQVREITDDLDTLLWLARTGEFDSSYIDSVDKYLDLLLPLLRD